MFRVKHEKSLKEVGAELSEVKSARDSALQEVTTVKCYLQQEQKKTQKLVIELAETEKNSEMEKRSSQAKHQQHNNLVNSLHSTMYVPQTVHDLITIISFTILQKN